MKYFKKLVGTKNIWEVRIRVGNDIIRLLGFIPTRRIPRLLGVDEFQNSSPDRDVAPQGVNFGDHGFTRGAPCKVEDL